MPPLLNEKWQGIYTHCVFVQSYCVLCTFYDFLYVFECNLCEFIWVRVFEMFDNASHMFLFLFCFKASYSFVFWWATVIHACFCVSEMVHACHVWHVRLICFLVCCVVVGVYILQCWQILCVALLVSRISDLRVLIFLVSSFIGFANLALIFHRSILASDVQCCIRATGYTDWTKPRSLQSRIWKW